MRCLEFDGKAVAAALAGEAKRGRPVIHVATDGEVDAAVQAVASADGVVVNRPLPPRWVAVERDAAAERLHPVLQPDQARAAGEVGAADAVVTNRDAQDLVACPQA
jgi:hypothetical protein